MGNVCIAFCIHFLVLCHQVSGCVVIKAVFVGNVCIAFCMHFLVLCHQGSGCVVMKAVDGQCLHSLLYAFSGAVSSRQWMCGYEGSVCW